MATTDLVQVGSALFVTPTEVVKIYRTDELPEKYPTGCVYVVTRSLGIMVQHDSYQNTDWPLPKVLSALGLITTDELEHMVEGGAS